MGCGGVSVSGDQRGIKKGNLESLRDAGGVSVSGDQRGILRVYGMRGVVTRGSQKGESKKGVKKGMTVYFPPCMRMPL